YVLFHQLRHLLELGAAEVAAFLDDLAGRTDLPPAAEVEARAALWPTASPAAWRPEPAAVRPRPPAHRLPRRGRCLHGTPGPAASPGGRPGFPFWAAGGASPPAPAADRRGSDLRQPRSHLDGGWRSHEELTHQGQLLDRGEQAPLRPALPLLGG